MTFVKRLFELLLDIIAFSAIGYAVMSILFYFSTNLYDYIEEDEMGEIASHPMAWMLDFTPFAIAAVVATLITHVFIFKRPFRSTGLGQKRSISDYLKGFLLGVVLIGIGFIILRLLGLYDILEYNDGYRIIALFLLVFIVQSFFEEVVFRSYLMPAIDSRFGMWAALIISSLAFGALHLSNSNIQILGAINIVVAGLLLGALFLKYDNVWAASGLHCSWNYFQSSIFGFEVSGERMYSLMNTEEVGPDVLTGGQFGFEGSIICTVLLGGLFLYLVLRDEQVKERLRRNTFNLSDDNSDYA